MLEPHRVHTIEFGHHIQPPAGFPKVLAEWVYTKEQCAGGPFTYECQEQKTLGEAAILLGLKGVYSYASTLSKPPRVLPQATIIRMRLNRLRKRMEARYPLFAQQFINEAIAANQPYYEGHSIREEERNQLIEQIRVNYERYRSLIDTQRLPAPKHDRKP